MPLAPLTPNHEWTLVASCATSIVSIYFTKWWFFRSSAAALPLLDSIPLGYLIGGPVRAAEIALFELVKDGHVQHDSLDRFFADPHASASQLPSVESELFTILLEAGPLSATDLLNRDLNSLGLIETQLERLHLAVSEAELNICRGLTLLGPLLTTALGWAMSLHLQPFHWLHLAVVGVWIAAYDVRRRLFRTTELGERVVQEFSTAVRLRREESLRLQASGHSSSYDRLWSIKDDVLLDGYRKLAGSPFRP